MIVLHEILITCDNCGYISKGKGIELENKGRINLCNECLKQIIDKLNKEADSE